jgi:two-component system, response regulator, stage 0 sporulation protein F
MSSDDSGLGRILVVDDEEPVRDVLCEYFESQGFGVEATPDGEAALVALGRHRPDLVLLDVRMPGIDGVEVLRRIRRADPDVPVIMVTANEVVALAKEMLKRGAFDYVAKPFDFSHLQSKEAGQHLGEPALVLGIAAELGDLTGPDLAAVESALSSARRALPSAG